ncbi:acylphosphatase [Synechococcus sp. PCC 7335]|uniref:acylphosphatase n=1 Tax=Synechococcus sp. (strain ATCC 29403 / PCC 7335) TaxID=91464 RepID=UPI00017ECA82|nr:acylphosphatase [Synechococcus sp. PCC 7335]EDX86643.1 acylphosphatase [Synechococcus sp. PCC 7335]
MVCFRVLISGKVQGVGYRYSTKEKAQFLGIVGWVRNLPNGKVEALIVGNHRQIESMMAWFHIGPPAASVSTVEVKEENPQKFESFNIL